MQYFSNFLSELALDLIIAFRIKLAYYILQHNFAFHTFLLSISQEKETGKGGERESAPKKQTFLFI